MSSLSPRENSQLSPKLMKRFYEALVLLRVLGQVQGEKISGETIEEGNFYSIGAIEMRRRVMYHLCIMCDFRKGGDTVTAMAAESLPSGPRYWVAANGSLNKIEPFLTEVLTMLETQASSNAHESEISAFERTLFEKFVSFHVPRTKEYRKWLQSCIEAELKRIDLSPHAPTGIEEYTEWLQRFQRLLNDADSFSELSQLAYNTRHSRFLSIGYDPITAQPVMMESESHAGIRHYIGRLCAPRRASILLAYAASSHQSLFHGFSVRCQRSAVSSTRPVPHSGLTLAGISGRMFPSQTPELENVRESLQALDEKGSLMDRIREHYKSDTWQPRVHAELELLEALHDSDCTFYDNDKYIACSKAACFCCYHYICGHPGSFTRPSCHNKVYLNWQPPKLNTGDDARCQQQRDIMNGLIQQVRQAAVERVLNTQRRMKWHPDSSTGITPSAIPRTGLGNIETLSTLARELRASGSQCGSLEGSRPNSTVESSGCEDSDDGGVPLT